MSDRAHDFDSTCNCGPCLEDRGLLADPECPRCTRLEDACRAVIAALECACRPPEKAWLDARANKLRDALDAGGRRDHVAPTTEEDA